MQFVPKDSFSKDSFSKDFVTKFFIVMFFLFAIVNDCYAQSNHFYFKSEIKAGKENIKDYYVKNKRSEECLRIAEGDIDLSNYRLVAHIDCGMNDRDFGFEASGTDSGRVHYSKNYTQAASYNDSVWNYNHYFSYKIPVSEKNGGLLVVFLDADNASRTYNIIVNDAFKISVRHHAYTSLECQPDSWKRYNLFISRAALRKNLQKIKFDHVGMPDYSPAIADIWVYEKIAAVAFENNRRLNF